MHPELRPSVPETGWYDLVPGYNKTANVHLSWTDSAPIRVALSNATVERVQDLVEEDAYDVFHFNQGSPDVQAYSYNKRHVMGVVFDFRFRMIPTSLDDEQVLLDLTSDGDGTWPDYYSVMSVRYRPTSKDIIVEIFNTKNVGSETFTVGSDVCEYSSPCHRQLLLYVPRMTTSGYHLATNLSINFSPSPERSFLPRSHPAERVVHALRLDQLWQL